MAKKRKYIGTLTKEHIGEKISCSNWDEDSWFIMTGIERGFACGWDEKGEYGSDFIAAPVTGSEWHWEYADEYEEEKPKTIDDLVDAIPGICPDGKKAIKELCKRFELKEED